MKTKLPLPGLLDRKIACKQPGVFPASMLNFMLSTISQVFSKLGLIGNRDEIAGVTSKNEPCILLKVRFFESQPGEIFTRNQFRFLVEMPVAGLGCIIIITCYPERVTAPFNGKDFIDSAMDTVIGHTF